jgi:amidohydrolase
MTEELPDYLAEREAAIRETWKDLHSIPEPAFQEERTSVYLAGRLRKAGYLTKTGLGGTGVIGVLRSGIPGPTVGLRADMDALCHEVDGQKRAIHSCGHDANCAMVLSAAEAVAACGGPQRGALKILFQPAEETLDGAKAMIRTGELDDLGYLLGIHLRPREELPFGKAATSIRHGASEIMLARFKGRPAHGARPHQGINAVEAASLAVLAVSGIKLDPLVPHSAKATMIRGGGTALNIIPDSAEIAFDLRAQTNTLMEELKARVTGAVSAAASVHGSQVEMIWKGGVPAAEDDPEVIRIAGEAIGEVLGAEGVRGPLTTAGGEDFHHYARAIKGLKTTVVGVGADLTAGLHQPSMTFHPDALLVGARVLTLMVKSLLFNNDWETIFVNECEGIRKI